MCRRRLASLLSSRSSWSACASLSVLHSTLLVARLSFVSVDRLRQHSFAVSSFAVDVNNFIFILHYERPSKLDRISCKYIHYMTIKIEYMSHKFLPTKFSIMMFVCFHFSKRCSGKKNTLFENTVYENPLYCKIQPNFIHCMKLGCIFVFHTVFFSYSVKKIQPFRKGPKS